MTTTRSTGWAATARLVRRTGFGATGTEVDAVLKEGAAAYVERILAADPNADPGAVATPAPTFDRPSPRGPKTDTDARKKANAELAANNRALTAWWLRRMAAVHEPFGEKLTFAWHAHFATSAKKVRDPRLMATQNQLLRTLGRGDFHSLAYRVLTDAATLRWLDGEKNTVKGPNENLSREFMEIFTLGHADGYTESDVREGARALTGWRIAPSGAASVTASLHDAGAKTLFGTSGSYDAAGFCDAVLNRPGSAAYVLGRLWTLLVSDTPPSAPVMAGLVSAYGPSRNLTAAIRAMLTTPAFAAAEATTVIGPVEWLLGAVRALHVPLTDAKQMTAVSGALDSLGQLPFYPPSVGGWPHGQVWLSTAAADLRFRTASTLMTSAQLPTLTGSTTARLEALAHLLGIDAWSDRTLGVLKGSTSSTAQLVATALNTPEYLVH